MGLSFSNMHLKLSHEPDRKDAEKIARLLIGDMPVVPVEDEGEADFTVTILTQSGSPWTTVVSDLFDEDLEKQLPLAQKLSAAFAAQVLTISCFDSDCICFQLFDAPRGKELQAFGGYFPFDEAPENSDPLSWKPYVADAEHFASVLRVPYDFMEECLPDAAEEFSLPLAQAESMTDCLPEECEAMQFRYRINKAAEEAPPEFRSHCPSFYYDTECTNMVHFVNLGRTSTGVAVCLSGPAVNEKQVCADELELLCKETTDERIPVTPEEVTFPDGSVGLLGTCPELRIPEKVKDGLSWKKQFDMEWARCITVFFKLSVCGNVTDYKPLQVTLIPLENENGQSGWVMEHHSKAKY